MRISALFAAALAIPAALAALPAAAQAPTLYAYETAVNYCPAGLRPVVLGGVVCCGQPTSHLTWQQVMRHPVQRARYRPGDACPEGQKGCN